MRALVSTPGGSVRDLALTGYSIKGKIDLARFKCHFSSDFRSYQLPKATGAQATQSEMAQELHFL